MSTEEDTELPVSISSDGSKDLQHSSNMEGLEYRQTEDSTHGGGLLSEGNNIYAYEELDEDVDLFINPVPHSDSKWRHQFRAFKNFGFWAATIGWIGMKVSTLFFWILLPVLSYEIANNSYVWMSLYIMAGFSTLLPNLVSYKILKLKNQHRRLYFGIACWTSAISLLGTSFLLLYHLI